MIIRSTIKRAFWVLMVVLHLGAIRSAWFALDRLSSDADLLSAVIRFLALTGSAAFFALKIVDVSWLRLRPGWRSRTSAVLVVALLHVGVVNRAVEEEQFFSPAHLGVVLFVGTLVEVGGLRRVVLRVRGLIAHLRAAIRPPLSECAHFHRQTFLNSVIPMRLLVQIGALVPRPPPLS